LDYSKQQKAILSHRGSHALVSAGPGTGKTTTMIAYIVSLLSEGFTSKDVLILMFNKDAQKDFSKRLITKIDGLNVQLPEVRTFHSLALGIIKMLESKGIMPKMELAVSQKFMEILAMDACIKTIGRAKFNDIQNKQSKVIDFFVQYLSLTKANVFLDPKESFQELGLEKEFDFFPNAFDKFEENRKYKKIRFFDDLLYDLALIINSNEMVRNWIGNKKEYVIIDEYQDTNVTQTVILKAIVGSKGNCIAVGDADQSLYEFRGAYPGIMTTGFDMDFPGAARFKLSYNFRYGKKIALISNALIQHNKDRFDQLCISHESNPDTKLHMLGSDNHGKTSLETIERKLSEGYELSDIVVLVRLFSQSVPVELALLKAGHKVNVEGGVSALNSKEMEAMISLLELSEGRFKEFTPDKRRSKFEAILKFPHVGINASAMDQLLTKLANADAGYGHILSNFQVVGLKKFQVFKIKDRGSLIKYFEREQNKKNKTNAYDMLKRYVRETDIKEGLSFTSMTDQEYSESIDRMEAILEFIKSSNTTADNLLFTIDEFRNQMEQNRQATDAIKITSIHRSKGLEWPIVIIPGLIETKFPYEPKKTMTIGNHEEGERRLLYVAITRGMQEVFVLTSNSSVFKHYINHGSNISQVFSIQDEPSKFIFETEYFGLEKCGYEKANRCPAIIDQYQKEIELIS
jgi:DNA helicase-2/ATP-dependent DNA helicase PcrA